MELGGKLPGDEPMSATTERFAIRWSASTWIFTVGAIVIICIGVVAVLTAAIHAPPERTVLRVVLVVEGLALIAILAIVALLAPLDYLVRKDSVIVRRLARNVVIPRASIRDVHRIARTDVGFAWRWFGSGGLLGFFGYFSSAKLGRFLAYVGDTKSLVLMTRADGRKILLSPCPPERFVELLREAPPRTVS
jgi:hypothetical protein